MHYVSEKGGGLTRRQFVGGAAALVATAALAACGGAGDGADSSASEPGTAAGAKRRTLTVFAAASLTEALQQIGRMFERKHTGVTVEFNFDSSGTLCTQIAEGAEADVFFSAAEKQMDQLDGGLDGQEGAGVVDHATRTDLLQNKVVLCVPDSNPKHVQSFDGLAKALAAHQVLMAMGNADVPVGQYTQRILAHFGLDESALAQAGCISYGSNVKEVAAQVREASVDCGVVYATDARAERLSQVDDATEAMCGSVTYPVAALKAAPEPKLASAFLDFLHAKAASARGAFESFDQTLADAARTLGRSNAWVFWRVKMPCCRQGIVAGAVLAFARALGEYGATSMVCGYMPGSTATVSTTVYQLWRTGDNAGALAWVLVNLAISCVVLVALNVVQGRTAGGRGAASFSPARGAAEGDAR